MNIFLLFFLWSEFLFYIDEYLLIFFNKILIVKNIIINFILRKNVLKNNVVFVYIFI